MATPMDAPPPPPPSGPDPSLPDDPKDPHQLLLDAVKAIQSYLEIDQQQDAGESEGAPMPPDAGPPHARGGGVSPYNAYAMGRKSGKIR